MDTNVQKNYERLAAQRGMSYVRELAERQGDKELAAWARKQAAPTRDVTPAAPKPRGRARTAAE